MHFPGALQRGGYTKCHRVPVSIVSSLAGKTFSRTLFLLESWIFVDLSCSCT